MKSELSKNNLESLEEVRSLSSGPSYGQYLLCLNSNSKIFILAHLGDWVSPETFKKYKTLYFRPTFNKEIYTSFTAHLKELKNSEWGEAYAINAHKFIDLWEKVFLTDKHPEFWTFLLALYEEFYPKEVDELQRIYQFAIPIYERSFHLAGITFYLAVKSGIHDTQTLKEIFLISLFINSALADPGFHYNLYHALEIDRLGKESGVNFLKQTKPSLEDIKFYVNHPLMSYFHCKQKLSGHVLNERLYELIRIQGEARFYPGPKGLSIFECDDTELIIILANKALPYIDINEVDIFKVIEEINDLKKILRKHHSRQAIGA